jgi:hypothetical protein
MQKSEERSNDLEMENHVLKQDNLKLTKKCEEYNFIVNKLQRESKEISQCFLILSSNFLIFNCCFNVMLTFFIFLIYYLSNCTLKLIFINTANSNKLLYYYIY